MNALQQLTQQFNLLKLRVTIQFKQNTVLPAFKGSMLHGWFGHALKQADEHAFFVCYGEHSNQQPKPYIITPNGDHKTDWHQHEIFDFEITLFGSAIELVDSLFIALKVGENMGFGKNRTPFSVVSINSVLPTHQQTGVHPFTLHDAISSQIGIHRDFSTQHEIALQLVTPLRLKYQGEILKKPPIPLELLLTQIQRRLILLSQFWVNDNAALFEQIGQQTPCLGSFESNATHCYFEDWLRYSLKERKFVPFSGLKGQLSFCGEITESLPLLMIGEQLHIGGKTTFGLGSYQLIH